MNQNPNPNRNRNSNQNRYRYEERMRAQKRRRNSTVAAIVIIVAILLLIGVAVYAVYYLTQVYRPSTDPLATAKPPTVTTDPNGDEPNPPSVATKEGFYNFLVLGKDVGGNNTDVFMLISFDTQSHAISLMQIPRDTYVEADGNHYKINALYAHMRRKEREAGLTDKELNDAALRDVGVLLGQNLNITIHYYAMMDLQGFRNIVDVLGGVYVDVPRDMEYHDDEQNLHISLKKGRQLLNGEKAEQFVRFRKGVGGFRLGDITRMDVQKIFITAFVNQVKTTLSVNTVAGMVSQMVQYVSTSMPLDDMIYFAQQFFSVDNSKIVMFTCPGEATYVEKISYYVVNRQQLLYYVNRHFNVFTADIADADFDANHTFVSEQDEEVYAIYNKPFTQPDGEKSAEDIGENGLPLI